MRCVATYLCNARNCFKSASGVGAGFVRSHEPLSPVAFGSELIALVTGSTDPASYWSRGGTTATGPFMEHVALVARRYWTAGVRQTMGLDEGLSVRQYMSILMVL
jgi:hypothetical protein